jgi:hypothetical protein
MHWQSKPILVLLIVIGCSFRARSQHDGVAVDTVINLPNKFFTSINSKTTAIEDRLTRKTEKYLQRMVRQENKLQGALSKVDSTAAKQLFANSQQRYQQLIAKIKSNAIVSKAGLKGSYLPGMDSMKTSLAFLQKNSQLLGNSTAIQQKVTASLGNVNELEDKLKQTEDIKAFILQRKQQIKEQLSKMTGLPGSVTSCVTDFNKQAYYYDAQVKSYKEMLNDPNQMVTKGLAVLKKLPAFAQFMKQHSEWASLFNLPDDYGSSGSLAGLQTRAQVQQQIQTQLASAGPGAQQYLQQNLQAAQAQLGQLKDKLLNSTGGGTVDDPNFRPNGQKTKTFWNRLEYGANFQTAKSSFFPTTTDIGLSIGYKLNDKNSIGIGASYKIGWGQDIKHIRLTQQGMGLRSYLDVKLKGSFYASGGFEYNYQPLEPEVIAPVNSLGKWNNPSAWTRSGLIGISKIVSVKSKFFKKTKLQLLWDFLSYQQVPRTQALKFRVGYNF